MKKNQEEIDMVARIYYVGGHCAETGCVIQGLIVTYAVGFFIFAASILWGAQPFTPRMLRHPNKVGNNKRRNDNKWTRACRDNRCLWVPYRLLVCVLLPSLL